MLDTVAADGRPEPGPPQEVTEGSAPLLRVRGLEVAYGRGAARRWILHSVDLDVGRGEAVGLIGETGAGKTTLVRTVLGVAPISAGSIDFAGVAIDGLRGRALRDFRRTGQLQYVFQDPLQSFDPDVSLGDSIAEGLRIRGGISHDEVLARVTVALSSVGLAAELANRRPSELSGGQRQRALIARALILDPTLLLLDEPVSALDAVSRIQILRLLRTLGRERQIAQVFISHDLGSVAGITDRIAVLYRGRIVEAGPTAQVLRQPQHPYTRLLIDSASTLRGGRTQPNKVAREASP